jgi:hypothetical protein
VDEAGMEDGGMAAEGGLGLPQQRRRLSHELLGGGELAAMDGADGVGGVAQRFPAAGESLLAGGVPRPEIGPHVIHYGF